MATTRNHRWLAIGCLLVGVCGGVAGAQVVENLIKVNYLNTGLFALAEGDTALFSVSLDDVRSGQPARVRLQFLDENGMLLASEDAVLGAGQSKTLRLSRAGLTRAHAEVVDPPLQLALRRTFLGMVEVIDSVGTKLPTSCTIHVPSGGGDGGRQ